MKYSYFCLTCIVLLNLNFIIFAEDIVAASSLRSDVQAAVDSASDGDTVLVPAGENTWDLRVNINSQITVAGAGISNTIIHKFSFMVINSTDNVRITNFTFNGDYVVDSGMALGSSPFGTGTKNFRIDHCKFINYADTEIWIRGYSYGVIDHCEFIDNEGEEILSYSDDEDSWARPKLLGVDDGVVFIEDCLFKLTGLNASGNYRNCLDTLTGARTVFRYNTVEDHSLCGWNYPIETHGYDTYKRGTVSIEIYENTFISNNNLWKRGIYLRGGSGVIFNNTFIGDFSTVLALTNYRSCLDMTYGGYCPDNEGYPCIDQINNLYVWNNTHNGSPVDVNIVKPGGSADCTLVFDHIQKDREYFLYEKPGYTPYQYPHPLVDAGSLIKTPSRLRIE